ncbi:MAG TPA: aconitase X catalytic domain-containing protein [Synergistales bacterium]|nr:aconitase X catalytic domain-containing protein [Synergistales bacterium]HPK42492.1 aconitase X catalytic domain-containing protein [Synergistales bacterium]
MDLNQKEKDMLEGKYGVGIANAMKILVGIGDAFYAERMVEVSRVHISLSNQEGDLWFANKLVEEGARCCKIATVNPAFNKEYFENVCTFTEQELKVFEDTMSAYRKIGVVPTFQCTPYFVNNVPGFKEIVAFAATGASCFVNSVCGARTNRESSQSALCSAVTGLTPLYGFLLDENRKADTLVEVEAEVKDDFDYQLLGYCLPKKIFTGVPVFHGLSHKPSSEALMNLSTQLNVHGVIPMFHVVGVTPEAATLEDALQGEKPKRKVSITKADLDEARKTLSHGDGKIDFVVMGCPHLTIQQIKGIAAMLEGKKLKSELWIFTSCLNKELSKRMGLADIIEGAGGRIVEDSCVDQPIWAHLEGKKGLTESPKCAYYVSRRKMKLIVRSIPDCVNAAIKGEVN